MANRLQRIMAMDQMIQNRNMPQIGTQNIFDPTSGQFVKVEYQTDPNFKGRRTVMTRTGPQVLPGFEGVENPYRQLGRGVRNLLGNLFDRGQRRRTNRKADQSLQSQEDILRERYRQAGPDGQMNTEDDILPELVTKAPTASSITNGEITFTQERFPGMFEEAGSYENRINQLMENQGISKVEAEQNQADAISRGMDLDNSGYVDDSEAFAFNNPMTAGQPLEIPAFRNEQEEKLRKLEEKINRPIMRGPAPLPTFDISQMSSGKMGQSDSLVTLANGDQAIQRVNKIGPNTYVTLFDPTNMRVISSTLPTQTTTPTTQTTGEETQSQDSRFKAKTKDSPKLADAKAAADLLGLEGSERTEFITKQVTGDTPTPQESKDFIKETHDLVIDLLDQDGVGKNLASGVGPIQGQLYTVLQSKETADFKNAHEKLRARLSKDNFGIMKGVLSDNDIRLLIAIGTGTLSLTGSEKAYVKELQKIRNKLETSMGRQNIEIPSFEGRNFYNPEDFDSEKSSPTSSKFRVIKQQED